MTMHSDGISMPAPKGDETTNQPSLVFMWEDGRMMMTINQDGTVTGGIEGASEAGRAFVASIRKELTTILHAQHTPTDDEREALTYLITAFRFRERGLRGVALEPDLAVSRPLAEFLLGEGFRRPEVPEPSAEHRDRIALAEFIDKALDGDAGYGVGDFLAGGILSFLSERSDLHASVESQGEPTDAQVDAAGELLYGISWGTDIADPDLVRAALRAAGGVKATPPRAGSRPETTDFDDTPHHAPIGGESPEPQAEPSDALSEDIEARALEGFLGKLAGDGAYTLDFTSAGALHGHIVSLLKRDIAALRAGGGVR